MGRGGTESISDIMGCAVLFMFIRRDKVEQDGNVPAKTFGPDPLTPFLYRHISHNQHSYFHGGIYFATKSNKSRFFCFGEMTLKLLIRVESVHQADISKKTARKCGPQSSELSQIELKIYCIWIMKQW